VAIQESNKLFLSLFLVFSYVINDHTSVSDICDSWKFSKAPKSSQGIYGMLFLAGLFLVTTWSPNTLMTHSCNRGYETLDDFDIHFWLRFSCCSDIVYLNEKWLCSSVLLTNYTLTLFSSGVRLEVVWCWIMSTTSRWIKVLKAALLFWSNWRRYKMRAS
jgi:hypothetical protein